MKRIEGRVKAYIIFFICAILVSGITAFPIESELAIIVKHITVFPQFLQGWLVTVYEALKDTNARYPFLAYGTDWLAWAHIVIAIMFLGPLRDPVKNIWVIQWGIIACILVFPLALIAGHFREVPLYWRLIDCSFGFLGLIPLSLCLKDIRKLEQLQSLPSQMH